jgi:hypothetical protein
MHINLTTTNAEMIQLQIYREGEEPTDPNDFRYILIHIHGL